MASLSILVPLDGSSTAERALPLANVLATAYGAQIRLLHVAGEAEGVKKPDDVTEAGSRFASYANEAVARAGVTAPIAAVETVPGKAADAILEAVGDARMIAIATHGRGGFKAAFIGSVADKVLHGAHVPVAVVSGAEGPVELGNGPVLVTLDGSEESERALPVARELARLLDRKVVLVRGFTLLPPVTLDVAYYPPNYVDELEESARAYLQSMAESGEEILLVNGPPAEAITDAANRLDASLTVMESGGKGLARRIALGSTTDRVVHMLRRPILIVPPPAS